MGFRHPAFAAAALVLLTTLLAGCASFGEGLGRAVLAHVEGDPDSDTRACEIEGAAFEGIVAALRAQDGQPPIGTAPAPERSIVKIMMVHGIGSHYPGYSGRTVANLTDHLGLDVVSPHIKAVDLVHPSFPGESIGTLTGQRFTDAARTREVIFYELTWSRVSDAARANLRFDNSQIHTRNRAWLNRMGKVFANDVLVDPLVYVGAGREKILTAVRQGLCWAYSTDWDAFPRASTACSDTEPGFASRLDRDPFFFVTHSLGSRIVLDALETTVEGIENQLPINPRATQLKVRLQNHTTTVFMMANQLPLLQAGFRPVPVTGRIAEFCNEGGLRYQDRMLGSTRIVAFSDPNDLLSYPIPDDFVQYGIDSRLCPSVVNVSLNVAKVFQLMGRAGFANPLTAHSDYNDDARVIGLMVGGLGQRETSAEVAERCNWVRAEEALR
jgi:hypothetical protein